MSENRRRSSRSIRINLPAEIELRAGAVEPVMLRNLGPDGAFIDHPKPPCPIGEVLKLRFRVDSFPIAFEVAAEVRWQRTGEGFGCQFQDLCPFDRAALDDYCQRRLELNRLKTGQISVEG